MFYVSPKIQEKLESLEPELREEILSRNVRLETLGDLIAVLEKIVAEGESR